MPGLFIDSDHHDWDDEARAAANEQHHDERLIENGEHYDPRRPPRPAHEDHRGSERICDGCGHPFRPDAGDRRATLCAWCAAGTTPLTDPTKDPR